MDNTNSETSLEIKKLREKISQTKLPSPLQEKALLQISRISLALKYGGSLSQFDIVTKYIDWITNLPWYVKTTDRLDINLAKQYLDKNHYGLDSVKQRILEYLAVISLKKSSAQTEKFHAPSLFFVGLVGTGKTTFAHSIAKSLGRKFIRIPFGGLSSPLDLRGISKVTPEAEPGMIIKGLRRVGSSNPVILLDELDRVTPEARAAIMGVLIELLDPEQNQRFIDHFIDYPFNLSEAIFIATANNTNNVSTAVLDRLEVIQMPSYNDEEKIVIGKKYLLPKIMKEAGLSPQIFRVDDSIWPRIIRPLGYDAGVRTLERTIEKIVRKAVYKIVSKETTGIIINNSNIKEFLE